MCLAVPGRVESIHEEHGVLMGRVSFGGIVKTICLACLPDIGVGEFALVHAGFAIGRIDEASAQATLQSFADLGLLDEELADAREAGARDGGGWRERP